MWEPGAGFGCGSRAPKSTSTDPVLNNYDVSANA